MALTDALFQTREAEVTLESGEGGVTLSQLFGAQETATGKRVTGDAALRHTAVWRAINFIAGHIASLPKGLFQGRSDGRGRDPVTQHPANEVVKRRANPQMAAVGFFEALQGHMLTRGNAYAEIARNGNNQASELWPLPPDKTKLVFEGGEAFYRARINGSTKLLPFDKVLHVPGFGFDGRRGFSPVTKAREAISRGLSMEEYASRFFSGAPIQSGILKVPESMTDEARKRLKRGAEGTTTGLSNAHRIWVLDAGIDWESIGFNNEDSQFLESFKANVLDISRIYGVPPHKLAEMSNATFSNISEQNIEVVQDTLTPWVTRWEDWLDFKLLTEQERRKGLFFKFNLNGLLRGNPQERAEMFRTRFNTASITPNQIRELEDENPLEEGGDEAFVKMDMVPLSRAGEMSAAERALLRVVEDGEPDAIRAVAELRAKELDHKKAEPEKESRSAQARRRLVNTFRPLFGEAAGRMVRAETQNLRSELASTLAEEGVEGWIEFLETYYREEHPSVIDRTGLPEVFRTYALEVAPVAADEADLEEPPESDVEGFVEGEGGYLPSFKARYSRSSRTQLQALARETDDGEVQEETEARLEKWEEGTDESRSRAERVADREVNRLGNATAKTVFVAAGIAALRWSTVGNNCPMCNALNGTVVGVRDSFVGEGEEFVGEDGETSITPDFSVGHPPLHQGCDCLVLPG